MSNSLKAMLTSPPFLYTPVIFEPCVFRIYSLDIYIITVLEYYEKSVIYFSCKFSPTEYNYPDTNHDLLAMFVAC